jgi:glycosyltransferase involved in cell wall biosynthesis
VDRESPEALAAAMRRLTNDRALGRTLGLSARDYAIERHGVDRMTENYLDVFQRVV